MNSYALGPKSVEYFEDLRGTSALRSNVNPSCTSCQLHRDARTVCLPDRGSSNPLIYFVGEGPGRLEDETGVAFTGQAGKLLERLMQRAGLDPSFCRWGNVVRCIPWVEGSNQKVRAPDLMEQDACSQWLEPTIVRSKPVFIVPLGGTAASYFLGEGTKISAVRGRRHTVELPTVRFRYQRLLKWLSQKDLPDDVVESYMSVTPNGREKAILKATVQFGFKDAIRSQYTIFPTWHPAAVLYGNADAEIDIVSDLNVLVDAILGKSRKGSYETLTDVNQIIQVLNSIREEYRAGKCKYTVFDFEANSLDTFLPTTFITTLAFTHKAGKAWGVPWDHHESPLKRDMLQQSAIRNAFNRFFEEVPVAGHNFDYDYRLGYYRGWRFPKLYDDTQEMGWTLTNDTTQHDLDFLTSKYTTLKSPKHDMKQAQSMLPKDERYNTDNHDLELVLEYNCMDVDSGAHLLPVLEKELEDADLLKAHRYFTIGAFYPVVNMEINGAPIDPVILSNLDTVLKKEMTEYYAALEQSGACKLVEEILNKDSKPGKWKKFSPTAPEQLMVMIYQVLGFKAIKYGKKRKKGKYAGQALPSADKHVLQALIEDANDHLTRLAYSEGSDQHTLWKFRLQTLKLCADYKRISKIHSSYVKNMPKHLTPLNYIHPHFGNRHTDSGRYNCQDPSLHTIPWHSPVKKMFVSRFEGGLILSADFSQMELRMFAMATGDEALIDAFNNKQDIHRMIAGRVQGIAPSEVSDDDRRRIKTVVFGMLYGRGPKSIAAQENISVERAKELISGIFSQFPKVRNFISEVHQFVNRNGFVRYINGFRRIIPMDPKDTSRAERQAVNTVIQGPASDMAVNCMINMYNMMRKLRVNSKHWEFKHDDLAFDIVPGELNLMTQLCRKEMQERPRTQFSYVNVPLQVDFEVGISWGQLVGLKIVNDKTLELDGEEENMAPLLDCISSWEDKPVVLNHEVKVKEKNAVVRSLMRASGEKVKYNHIKTTLQFPDFVRREPTWRFPGFTPVS